MTSALLTFSSDLSFSLQSSLHQALASNRGLCLLINDASDINTILSIYDPIVQAHLHLYFVFFSTSSSTEDGQFFLSYYKITQTLPIILLIDPVTSALLRTFSATVSTDELLSCISSFKSVFNTPSPSLHHRKRTSSSQQSSLEPLSKQLRSSSDPLPSLSSLHISPINSCHVLIRKPDGSTIIHEFSLSASVANVLEFLNLHNSNYVLRVPYERNALDNDLLLSELGLGRKFVLLVEEVL
ncbi:hypothetical protein RCL1_008900 [Eukaryota sp. TZLM3-RCL]